MSRGEIRVGDIGTTFILTIKDQDDAVVNVSSSSVRKITFNKPDGTAVSKGADFTTDGSDGKIQYTTILSDLNLAGEWQMQGRVIVGTNTWRTDIQKFSVFENLTEPT